ncbi:hypothetical protein B9Z19DRAFT_1125971 [Tuber borchii]|uniref:Myb-like DNA-binding domain-containing protein n=1 Tax=Tuber borchii TaxID=42251 RepID=A0A2T6ZTK7_TUBBO|nr:hypothetical protein B9Z19DRAFT_1125971 [Tuber borchii]
MPPASEEVLFLISCVRNTGDGKPNWKAVCDERGIVSTNAATKRWYRLSNANPVSAAAASSTSGAAEEEAPAKAPREKVPKADKVPKGKKPPKEKKAGASPRKKRKTGKEAEAEVEKPQPTSTSTVEGENESMEETMETNGAEVTEGSSD